MADRMFDRTDAADWELSVEVQLAKQAIRSLCETVSPTELVLVEQQYDDQCFSHIPSNDPMPEDF
jgi:hypothetical protein